MGMRTILRGQFQSTLPRRERRIFLKTGIHLLYFNPRSREGSDPENGFISFFISDFNPRSREGSDYII